MARPRKIPCHPNASLREHPDRNYYIAKDLDDPSKAWMWAKMENGWATREPFPVEALEGAAYIETHYAWRTGWPGCVPLPKAPRKLGRPSLPPEQRRSTAQTILLTAPEYLAIAKHAALAGQTISAWIVAAIAERLEAVGEPSASSEASAERKPS